MSDTRVTQWQQCRQAYKLKYLDRAPSQRADCLDLGIVVHRALELLVGTAKAKGAAGRLTHVGTAARPPVMTLRWLAGRGAKQQRRDAAKTGTEMLQRAHGQRLLT